MSPAMVEKFEKAGKVVATVSAIVGAVVGLTSWTTHKLVIEPLQQEIAGVRKEAEALGEWKKSQDQQSRTSADVLRDRLTQHEVAMAELRGTIEALRVELRYARVPPQNAGASTSTALTRSTTIEDVRASSDRALGRSTAALNELRGDPLRGLNEL